MKTLQSFFLLAALVLAGTNLRAESYYESVVSNTTALKNLISEQFSTDMNRVGNYLYEHDVRKIDSKVEVTFLINYAGQINILKINCDDCDAASYAKELLHMKKLNVSEDMKGKKYKMNIVLKYKAVS